MTTDVCLDTRLNTLGRVGTVTLDANTEAAMSEPFTYDATNVEKFAKFF